MKKIFPLFFTSFLLTLSVIGLTGCDQEENEPELRPPYEVPAAYLFEQVNYDGQLQRLSMLVEMENYLSLANTPETPLDAGRLLAMYANDAASANWAQNYDASKQLKNKTFENEQSLFEELLLRQATASQSTQSGAEGRAGVVTSLNGSRRYLLGPTGVEYAELIEKGLMGACFYYQATAVYLGSEKMNVDNTVVTPGEGTAMQHHWDEAFGYLGVPRDFPENTEGLAFWGTYCNRRDALLKTNARLMDSFLLGRAAINNNDLKTRDEAIARIRQIWEEVVAGSAISYLNTAIGQFEDTAIRAHALSEGAGFLYALQFNPARSLSLQEVKELLTLLGGGGDLLSLNFYQTRRTDLITARDRLASAFDMEDVREEL